MALEIRKESHHVLESKFNETGQVSPKRTQISLRNLVLAEVSQASCAKLQLEDMYLVRGPLPRFFLKNLFFFVIFSCRMLPKFYPKDKCRNTSLNTWPWTTQQKVEE